MSYRPFERMTLKVQKPRNEFTLTLVPVILSLSPVVDYQWNVKALF